MKFILLDRIESLSQERITATKAVSLAEEYLADHFPTFPVLPGVMMLEALTQTASWLLHYRRDFAKSVAVLKDARNVRYGQFVAPGMTLRMEVDFVKDTPSGASFKASGLVDGALAVSAKIEIAYLNLADKTPGLAGHDAAILEHVRSQWALLQQHTLAAQSLAL